MFSHSVDSSSYKIRARSQSNALFYHTSHPESKYLYANSGERETKAILAKTNIIFPPWLMTGRLTVQHQLKFAQGMVSWLSVATKNCMHPSYPLFTPIRTVKSLVLASLMAVMLLEPRGVAVLLPGGAALNVLLSRREKGLIICVMLDMARLNRRGVLFMDSARLTRLPNLHTSHHTQPCHTHTYSHSFISAHDFILS